MKSLLIATTNAAKFEEAKAVLEDSEHPPSLLVKSSELRKGYPLSYFRSKLRNVRRRRIKILGLKDFPDIKQVPETGESFEENAVLKAKGYFLQTGIPTIADDGGLAVDALGGLPGVHSHRWLARKRPMQSWWK